MAAVVRATGRGHPGSVRQHYRLRVSISLIGARDFRRDGSPGVCRRIVQCSVTLPRVRAVRAGAVVFASLNRHFPVRQHGGTEEQRCIIGRTGRSRRYLGPGPIDVATGRIRGQRVPVVVGIGSAYAATTAAIRLFMHKHAAVGEQQHGAHGYWRGVRIYLFRPQQAASNCLSNVDPCQCETICM